MIRFLSRQFGKWPTALNLRSMIIVITSFSIALLLMLAHISGFFKIADALFFDAVTLREAGRSPKVLIVRSDPAFAASGSDRYDRLAKAALRQGVLRVAFPFDPKIQPSAKVPAQKIVIGASVKKVPGTRKWQLVKAGHAALVMASAEYGIYRRQFAWLDGKVGRIPVFESAAAGRQLQSRNYMLRLSRNQNLPRIDASQLLDGSVDVNSVKGLILLMEPPTALTSPKIATAKGGGAQAISRSSYSAAAIQTLADRREVVALPIFMTGLLLAFVAIILSLLFIRYDTKRIIVLAILAGLAATITCAVSALLILNWLLPITALLLLQLLVAPIILYRTELNEDQRLRRFITRTVNLASRNSLMQDIGRVPEFLITTSTALGITKMALVDASGKDRLSRDEEDRGSSEDFTIDRRSLQRIRAEMHGGNPVIDGQSLAPDWPGDVRLASVGSSAEELYWLYALPEGPLQEPVGRTAAAAAASYRRMQSLREELSAGIDQRRQYHPIDLWAGGAVELIAERSDQIAAGLDQLDTAIVVFHQIGFPLHANARMAALYEIAGLTIADTDLPKAIAALTELERDKIDALLRELLLNGGEMRVYCRDFDTRLRNLRIAAPKRANDDQPRTIILEAIDITDLKYLAELNMSVGSLLNIQLRNDLEALSLAVAMAKDARLSQERRDHVLGQVEKASTRARSRLEHIAGRFRDVRSFTLTEAYPIELTKIVEEASHRTADQMQDLNVQLDLNMPSVGGYVIAEPRALIAMIEAILQIVSADTLPGDKVHLKVEDTAARSIITITGGVGMAFDQVYRAIDSDADDAPAPFQAFGEGLSKAVRWGAFVTYASDIGKGYRFNIDMRRIG
jgi:PAS domain-containing protein